MNDTSVSASYGTPHAFSVRTAMHRFLTAQAVFVLNSVLLYFCCTIKLLLDFMRSWFHVGVFGITCVEIALIQFLIRGNHINSLSVFSILYLNGRIHKVVRITN